MTKRVSMGKYDREVVTDREKLREAWKLNKNNMQKYYRDFEDYVQVSKNAHAILEFIKYKIRQQEFKRKLLKTEVKKYE